MHLPDGFLTSQVWISAWAAAIAGLGFCVRMARSMLKDSAVPLMGVMAAFIFAAQMVNFPVLAGTSGHLLGGVLAAVLLGPAAGALVLACVLIVQCLIFQDGGLTALGANIVNMSFIGTMGGYAVFVWGGSIFPRGEAGQSARVFLASWISVPLAALACSFELVLSGAARLSVVVPAMVGIHLLIGIGEAFITVFVFRFVRAVRPDLVYAKEGRSS